MSGRREEQLKVLVRVRRVRARAARLARARAETAAAREAGLLARVRALLAESGLRPGITPAATLKARLASEAMLARLAEEVGRRLDEGEAGRVRLAVALGRAQAAVDAAVTRASEAEADARAEAQAGEREA